jgi:hypothetical protein
MKRIGVSALAVGLVLLSGASVLAHHSYAEYLTEQRVTIEGTLEDIKLANPHVIMKIRTADDVTYTVIWQAALWVRRIGVTSETFKFGDHLVIYGAPSRDPKKNELASLRSVERPKDGWAWRN